MTTGVKVTFHGVRGSTPCGSTSVHRFGGNTSCVVLEREGEAPIVCDAGTGLRYYGMSLGSTSFDGTILISHLHWDHIQGLPFFPQIIDPDSDVDILGPSEDDQSFGDALTAFCRPPYFPVTVDELPGTVRFGDFDESTMTFGTARVTAAPVPHNGKTNGYRIEWGGRTIAYIPDHQEPADGTSIAGSVLELARGADLLIHDAQYTPELLAERPNWGHCTTGYACRVAEEAGVERLALFHHDPQHTDDAIERLEAEARSSNPAFEVFAAAEGLALSL